MSLCVHRKEHYLFNKEGDLRIYPTEDYSKEGECDS